MPGPLQHLNPRWQQTMLRIKDPKVSIPFYTENFGFKLVQKYDFPEFKFSLYFMVTPKPGDTDFPEPGTKEASNKLWKSDYVTLELTHNYGTENDADFKYNNGNVEPHRGFGHIAVFTDDVYKACETLEKNQVKFQKKPDDGRMKGLAFALDPDGYWIEIIKRAEGSPNAGIYTLSQTMLRVKDKEKSLKFYQNIFGMRLLTEKHFESAKFSLYFLDNEAAQVPESVDDQNKMMKAQFHPVLELTHNHGTENDEAFSYHNGNTEPKGFGHIGFVVDDLQATCDILEKEGVKFQKKPSDGSMKHIAFALDPDGYWIELISRNIDL